MPKMKTLTIGGVTFEVSDPESVCFTEQTLDKKQKAQARKNIDVDGSQVKIEVLDSDPVGDGLFEGRIWILKTTTEKLTIPVIELGNVGENSIAIKLSNASFDGNGDVVTTYKVYVNGVLNKTATISAGGTCVINGLSPETEYQISVRGVKGTELSDASNTLTAVTEESTQKGEVAIVIGVTSGEASGNINLSTWAGNVRATAVYTAGKKACVNQQSDEVYYPIPVPADATSVTVVCPGMQFGYNGWNLATNAYSYDVDSGWKSSGATYTFEAGAAEYATINFNKGSSNITAAELANITITFGTNSDPEVPDVPDEPDEPEVPDDVTSEIVILNKTSAGSSGNEILLNATNDYTKLRAVAVYTTGAKALSNSYDNNTYYPIPVPADATSVTVVCPGLRYGFDGWNLTNSAYSYDVNSGWKSSGSTYTLEAGAAEYATIGFSKADGSMITDAELAGITITFGTNSDPEVPDEPDNTSSIVIVPRRTVSASDNDTGVAFSDNAARACAVATSGSVAVPPTLNGVQYYMVKVPENVTSCTIVCPGLMWGFNGWNRWSSGILHYDVDSGWKASGATYTFKAGAAEYVSIGFKKESGGSFTEADESISGISITFA